MKYDTPQRDSSLWPWTRLIERLIGVPHSSQVVRGRHPAPTTRCPLLVGSCWKKPGVQGPRTFLFAKPFKYEGPRGAFGGVQC